MRTGTVVIGGCVAMLVMASADVRTAAARAPDDAVVFSAHPVVREALARIARGSPTWRRAIESLADAGRRALILTPDDVVVRDPASGTLSAFDQSDIAEAAPVADALGNVSSVLVVLNVDRLRELHDRRGSLPGEFLADLDRVLAHEVYGHAVPYLAAGHVSGRCADPDRGQPATDACAIQRENVIRAELRLGRRTDAALGSLSLTRLLRY